MFKTRYLCLLMALTYCEEDSSKNPIDHGNIWFTLIVCIACLVLFLLFYQKFISYTRLKLNNNGFIKIVESRMISKSTCVHTFDIEGDIVVITENAHHTKVIYTSEKHFKKKINPNFDAKEK